MLTQSELGATILIASTLEQKSVVGLTTLLGVRGLLVRAADRQLESTKRPAHQQRWYQFVDFRNPTENLLTRCLSAAQARHGQSRAQARTAQPSTTRTIKARTTETLPRLIRPPALCTSPIAQGGEGWRFPQR
jgi:hypothetical protein